MKITLSKSQWNYIGRKAGWMGDDIPTRGELEDDKYMDDARIEYKRYK